MVHYFIEICHRAKCVLGSTIINILLFSKSLADVEVKYVDLFWKIEWYKEDVGSQKI